MRQSLPGRRDVLRAAAGATAAASIGMGARAAAAQPVRYSTGTEKPKLRAPAGAADCHFHIYDNRFPPAPGGLPAPDASPDDYRALPARIGTTRGVVIQPSHCQINMPGDKIVAAGDTFLRVRGKLVFDHLAHCPQPQGVESDTFKLIRRLLDKGNTWVKLSGAYADTKVGPPGYADSSAVARALAAAAPTRIVWGSDWPHPTEKPDNKPDDSVLFDLLTDWVPDEAVRNRVLVANPAELYDFPKG